MTIPLTRATKTINMEVSNPQIFRKLFHPLGPRPTLRATPPPRSPRSPRCPRPCVERRLESSEDLVLQQHAMPGRSASDMVQALGPFGVNEGCWVLAPLGVAGETKRFPTTGRSQHRQIWTPPKWLFVCN